MAQLLRDNTAFWMEVDWEAVYRATYDDLVRYLYRLVQDKELAEDLAQEAFARVLGQPARTPRALLFTVAGNLARDAARSASRKRYYLRRLPVDQADRVAPDPAEHFDRERQREMARRALDLLSDRDREALLLWDAGLSYAEIADRTGLSRGAIGTTLARARNRLVAAYQALERGRHGTHR